jgi:hypothetical protein
MGALMPDTLRYVVLRHTGIPDPHFDLMVEAVPGARGLATWRLDAWPVVGQQIVQRLVDHRPTYLIYEGPISGDRGAVTRVRAGKCWVDQRGGDVFIVTFDIGDVLRLWPAGDGTWLVANIGSVRDGQNHV